MVRDQNKSFEQLALLYKSLERDPSWSRKTVQALKKQLGLPTTMIYKWGYDKKKSMAKEAEEISTHSANFNVYLSQGKDLNLSQK